MKKLYNILLLGSLVFSLVSCSYFETEERQSISVSQDGSLEGDVGVREDITTLPENYGRDISMQTDGRVQIYGEEAQSQTMSPDGDIIVSTKDDVKTFQPVSSSGGSKGNEIVPGVEVFSLDTRAPVTSPSPFSSVEGYSEPQQDNPLVIYFGYNSARLGSGDMEQIRDFAAMYRSGFAPMISVEGHASPDGGYSEEQKKANMKISLDRANAVARALIDSGVPAEKIIVQALGDTQMPSPHMNPGKTMDEAGRRVEVHIQ